MKYAPALVDYLVPEAAGPELVRATMTEHLLLEACKGYGDDWGLAAASLLGLSLGTHGTLLTERRRIASATLGIHPDTFRRHQEHDLLWDIAVSVTAEALQTS